MVCVTEVVAAHSLAELLTRRSLAVSSTKVVTHAHTHTHAMVMYPCLLPPQAVRDQVYVELQDRLHALTKERDASREAVAAADTRVRVSSWLCVPP
jgi:hypothetical protein